MAFYVVFSGNNYLNENQMSRNCSNIEQMERNFVNPHQMNKHLQQQPHELNSNLNAMSSSSIAATKPTIPTTIDGLIDYIATMGDSFEEKIIAEIAQMNERSLFR